MSTQNLKHPITREQGTQTSMKMKQIIKKKHGVAHSNFGATMPAGALRAALEEFKEGDHGHTMGKGQEWASLTLNTKNNPRQ